MKEFLQYLPLIILLFARQTLHSQSAIPDSYNLTWTSQSKNSSESMPCGGGDIGLNVWVENNELLFYFSRSGTFDANNTFLKSGRIRIRITPDPFIQGKFMQQLVLQEGYVKITGENEQLKAAITVRVDVFQPVIHVEINGDRPFTIRAVYENWRYEKRPLKKNESFQNSYKWAPPADLTMDSDVVRFRNDAILFYHRNRSDSTVFDVSVHQQGLDTVKHLLFNPLRNLTFGGLIYGENLVKGDSVSGIYQDTPYKGWTLRSQEASSNQLINICLHTEQTPTSRQWEQHLQQMVNDADQHEDTEMEKTRAWWNSFWDRSFVIVEPETGGPESPEWQMGRNYQLFRYMLGCNACGSYPTKFNGGLFTYDPCLVDSTRCFTPDYRNWGGGTFTAQNQRLVYFPMLKSGDFDLMEPQFEFYLRTLKNAELRSRVYWDHAGACYTEQLENFGLPNCTEYGWKRPQDYDKGLQYNAWLEYQWDTSLEFCQMMLDHYYYDSRDISAYLSFILSCVKFFDEHYRYLAERRGQKRFDTKGDLILYPGSACETYKMTRNSTTTIAGLVTVIRKLLGLPDSFLGSEEREYLSELLDRIPPISYREFEGRQTIAPANTWERINNTEAPQLYPVYPYGFFGIGRPDIEIAINTYKCDTDLLKFRSHIGWKQDNIFAARLGLTEEAFKLTRMKLMDSGRRFPAFWGPGFDYVPDHSQGGSGMIGMQEMLLQATDEKIYLFPAWPAAIDVHFKLHAPDKTIIEAKLTHGKVEILSVQPVEREKDIVILVKD